jgi:hypothetical protein
MILREEIMGTLRIVVGVVAATICLSGAIWVGRFGPWTTKQQTARELAIVRRQRTYTEFEDLRTGREPRDSVGIAADPLIDPRPPIADKPPFPKLAVEERIYRFGTMEVGEEKTHTFRVENKGAGPLLIGRGPTQCKCTISRLTQGTVPPGGFAEVKVSWKPVEFEQSFAKTAMVYTNDPEAPEIDFAVLGRVVPKVEVQPLAWNIGEITKENNGTTLGKIGSPLNADFKIATIETADPNLKISYKPLAKPDLNRAGWSAGYEFTAAVGQGIPWGRYRSKARIRTTADPDHPVDVDVTAVRTGDIRFLPPVPIVGSATWSLSKTLLNLGIFGHEQGRKVAVPALVSAMKGDFRLASVESDVNFLKISVEPDPKSSTDGRQGVRFVVEVVPGSAPLARPTSAPVHVTLKTNHPALSEIGFDIAFVSR